jgi:trigger factor
LKEISCKKHFTLPSGEQCEAVCVIPDYKGLPVRRQEIRLGHNEVELELQRRCVRHGVYLPTDQPAARGDQVNLDFCGFLNGQMFDDGKIEHYELKLGSNTFLKDFEEQIMGHCAGESFSILVSFPEQYPAEELCGQTAQFDLTLNEVRHFTVPQPSDEIACKEGYADLAEMTEQVRQQRLQLRRAQQDEVLQKQLLQGLIRDARAEIPEALLTFAAGQLQKKTQADLRQRGMNMEQYLHRSNLTEEGLQAQLRQRAIDATIKQLVVDTIAQREKLSPTEAEVEKMLHSLHQKHQGDMVRSDTQMKALLREKISCQRVEQFLLEQGQEQPWAC